MQKRRAGGPARLDSKSPRPVASSAPISDQAVEATESWIDSSWSVQTTERLLTWYEAVRRPLPWRQTRDPWAILLSEIMCQQTRAEVVVPYYHRYLQRFPTYEAMARAPLEEVVAMWSGLGYYSRARNLHRCAVALHDGGGFPREKVGLLQLPGVGDYTASALMSMAFARPCLPFDGNLQRVFARFYRAKCWNKKLEASIRVAVEPLIASEQAANLSNALMELGASLCRPNGAPNCGSCPLVECQLRDSGDWAQYPPRKTATKTQDLFLRALVIYDEEGVFLCDRHPMPFLRGLWLPPLFEYDLSEVASENQVLTPGAGRSNSDRDRLGEAGDSKHTLESKAVQEALVPYFRPESHSNHKNNSRQQVPRSDLTWEWSGRVRHGITFRNIRIEIWSAHRGGRDWSRIDPDSLAVMAGSRDSWSLWPCRFLSWTELKEAAIPSLTAKILSIPTR